MSPSDRSEQFNEDWDVVDVDDDGEFERENEDEHPAAITIRATTTINPKRPRTIRAGYEYATGTLTVIFRDGTWWNYYKVPSAMWEAFRTSQSKGRYLASSGLDKWENMGEPNMSAMSKQYVEALSGSRYAQLGTQGKRQLGKIKGVRGMAAIKRGQAIGQRPFEHENRYWDGR